MLRVREEDRAGWRTIDLAIVSEIGPVGVSFNGHNTVYINCIFNIKGQLLIIFAV